MNDDWLDITQKLIRLKTISRNYKEMVKCAKFIENYAKRYNLYFEMHDNDNNPVLLLSSGEKRDFDILSLGHIDVVDAPDEMFTPIIEGNILRGRGCFDMKAGVAVGMDLLRWSKEQNHKIKMGLVLTSDEEILVNQSMQFVQNMGIKSNIIFDTDALSGVSTIVEKNKNVIFVDIISRGKIASGMLPWEGNSAIDSLMDTLTKIRKHFPYYGQDKLPDSKKFGRHYWVNSLNIGEINGGKQINRVSDIATARLDFRLVAGMTQADLNKILQGCMNKNTTYNINWELGFVDESRDNPVIKEYAQIVEEEIGQKVSYIRDGRSSNSAMLKDKKGASVILHSYTGGEQHTNNEWLNIDSVNQLKKIQQKFILNYMQKQKS